eukprot:TRINITY_DN63641_c0_g1_i1.p1 TRINITY_DN63641_c0_g1~~TRINITY_DN63641_c0_g1_i1.p1  ORF type:complete len:153 (-),score=17.80 TRINITY_DN63641_c0_g1_i1:229-687(-)
MIAVRMFNDAFPSMGWFKLIMGKDLSALKSAMLDLTAGMRKVERVLDLYGDSRGPFLLGESFSVAECLAAPLLIRGERYLRVFRGIDMMQLARQLGLPRLHEWMEAVLDRPSLLSTSVDEQTMVTNVRKQHPEWFNCDDKVTYRVTDGEVIF